MPGPVAVVFDLDGVLMDSEQLWNQAKRELVAHAGGRWSDEASYAMMGMSSPEWSAYMHDELAVPLPAVEINRLVLARMQQLYHEHVPLIPGASVAVHSLRDRWTLGLASSSNREIIDLALGESGLAAAFGATVSSEEVPRGKPAPDVYLEAARRVGVDPSQCVAVEDSSNGLRSAAAAGMTVIAIPNPHYPPSADALGLAAVSIVSVGELTPQLVERAAIRDPGGASVAPHQAR
ncbi:MAG: HAD family hydrolase [Solirubrobacteraceae bacterium]